MKLSRKLFFKLFSFYPPFIGAGIRVSIADDVSYVDVSMKLRWYNRNYVGTHYGGSLYSMCDPFYMFLLIENLGRGYVVWDRSASIRFRKPGKGRVSAHFHISEERYAVLRQEADNGEPIYPRFTIDVKDEEGDVVATVEKEMYIKKKDNPSAKEG